MQLDRYSNSTGNRQTQSDYSETRRKNCRERERAFRFREVLMRLLRSYIYRYCNPRRHQTGPHRPAPETLGRQLALQASRLLILLEYPDLASTKSTRSQRRSTIWPNRSNRLDPNSSKIKAPQPPATDAKCKVRLNRAISCTRGVG